MSEKDITYKLWCLFVILPKFWLRNTTLYFFITVDFSAILV